MNADASREQPRVAVVGCGYWGKNLVRNFAALDALEVVCDSTAQGRKLAEELAPNCDFESDFDAVLDNGGVHAVVLATPAETHCELAIKALESGKDVFVEKPLAMNVAEGTRMQAAAEEAGKILMVGHLLEYHPAIRELEARIEAGELGKVNYMYSHRLNFGKIRLEENALWSFAPHDIAVMLRLFGEKPSEVSCSGGSYITSGLADVTVSNLSFPSGARGHIFVSWLNPFKEQRLVVVGDEKMAVFDDVASSDKLVLYHQKVEVEDRLPVLHKEGCEPVAFPADEPLRLECEHFLRCVATREKPVTDSGNGIAVLQVLQACQQSLSQNGNPVSLNAF